MNTHQELIHLALQKLVQHHRPKSLFELAGQIDFQEPYDPQSLRTMRQSFD